MSTPAWIKDIGWDEKLTLTEEHIDGKRLWVVGC